MVHLRPDVLGKVRIVVSEGGARDLRHRLARGCVAAVRFPVSRRCALAPLPAERRPDADEDALGPNSIPLKSITKLLR